MKTIVVHFIFLLAFSVQLSAQTEIMGTKTNVVANGTHFIEPVKDKKWSNSNGKDYTKASFTEFSGSCYVNLEVEETGSVGFHSFIEMKKGKMEVRLVDEEETVYFYCGTTEKCDLQKDVVLEKGKKYRLLFTGVDAKGRYLVRWD
ncbi:hypothetical protein ACI6PS_15885 [Flavobacterium sp. PLA-1-15]|uniref:hypothetical protein n=1 Tax=Flavobacterium sp. PLA-1-15 TaxID=3380533 RepID=UPI003B7A63D1